MNPMELREMVVAFQKSRIILTAYELDIFTFLDKDKKDSATVANTLNLEQDATERLLNALTGLKLLEKSDGKFSNTNDSFMLLSRKSPQYMSGFMHTNHLWNTWSHLTEVVRTGKAAHDTQINDRSENWLEAFIQAMHDRGMKQAPDQVAKIDLQNVDSVLDIGGGSGCFSMAFLERKPELKAVVFDLPNVIPISKRIIEKEGFAGRISHHTGDYTSDELPSGFDLVFLSAIIHSNSFETNQALVQKCYNALKPGGRIVIQDWIMDDSKTEPAQGTIFSINMLVGTDEGTCFSENEIRTWFEKAGFAGFKKNKLEFGLSQAIAFKK